MQPSQPEHSVVRSYLEWILDLPWVMKEEEEEDGMYAPSLPPSLPPLVSGMGRGEREEIKKDRGGTRREE